MMLSYLSFVMYTFVTVETAYKVYVCPRGNMRIYLITDLKLL